jgi:hypothetical protein
MRLRFLLSNANANEFINMNRASLLIDDYFRFILNKIDINTETLLNDKNLTKTKRDTLMDFRKKQPEILDKIKKKSFMRRSIEDRFTIH